MFEKLLFPTKIDYRNIKNKVVAAPPPSFLCEEDGNLTPQFFTYYKNLAQSEPGILIIEPSAVSETGKAWHNQCVISEDNNFLAISELVVKMRSYDILPMIQLYHGGINSIPSSGYQVFGPSKIVNKKIKATITELTSSDIEKIVDDYKKAASSSWNAGFAGVEINAADGTLLHQFLSPITNKRNDEYAFGFNNGILILRKIVNAVKSIASDFIISVKLSLRDLIPGGAGLKSSIEVAEELKSMGVELFHVSEGLQIGEPESLHPFLRGKVIPAPFSDDALIFRTETKTKVILSNGMLTPDIAEKQLSKESCDFVSLGRILNCEPEWITMAMTNQPLEFYKKCKNCMICFSAKNGCIVKR